MFIVGGVCFLLVGLINDGLFYHMMPFRQQMVIGGVIVTIVEFIAGYIFNIRCGLGIWDYSQMPFNIMGQVCLPFTLLWILLSGIAIVFDDYLRYWLFDDVKPKYKF